MGGDPGTVSVDVVVRTAILVLSRGALYALLASGFALVFGTARVLNLFHGSLFVLGAYAASLISSAAGGRDLAPFLGVSGAAVVAALAGLGYHALFLRRPEGRTLGILATGLAANLAFAEAVRAAFGPLPASVPPLAGGTFAVAGAAVSAQEVLVFVVAVTLFGILWAALKLTRPGLAIRAVAQDPKGARIVGFEPSRSVALAVAVASAMAGLAGGLAAPARVVFPGLWAFALAKSFTVVVVGGAGSLAGAVTAAFGLAAVEVLVSARYGEAAAELAAVALVAVALLVRPRGIGDEDGP